MLEQLLPFARFDGYYILSDLTGVPDLFARAAPIVKGTLTGPADPRTVGLTHPTRIIVTAWVLCVIPLLTVIIGYLLLQLPQTNRALWHAATTQAHLTAAAVDGHQYAAAATAAIGVALTAVPAAGTLYITAGLARRAAAMGLRWSAGRPSRRVLAAVAALCCLAALAAYWTVQGQFRGW